MRKRQRKKNARAAKAKFNKAMAEAIAEDARVCMLKPSYATGTKEEWDRYHNELVSLGYHIPRNWLPECGIFAGIA